MNRQYNLTLPRELVMAIIEEGPDSSTIFELEAPSGTEFYRNARVLSHNMIQATQITGVEAHLFMCYNTIMYRIRKLARKGATKTSSP